MIWNRRWWAGAGELTEASVVTRRPASLQTATRPEVVEGKHSGEGLIKHEFFYVERRESRNITARYYDLFNFLIIVNEYFISDDAMEVDLKRKCRGRRRAKQKQKANRDLQFAYI